MTQKYDPRIHDLNFKSVYENSIMRKEFLKHLEKEFNSEPFIFHFEVKKFMKIKTLEEQKAEFKKLFLTFFQKGKEGEKVLELNVPAKLKSKMKKFYEEIESKTNLEKEKQYLLKISKTVNQEIEIDSVKNITLQKKR
jgi:hypothetical protein